MNQPSERAMKAAEACVKQYSRMGAIYEVDGLKFDVARAIDAAVLAERERAAKFLEDDAEELNRQLAVHPNRQVAQVAEAVVGMLQRAAQAIRAGEGA